MKRSRSWGEADVKDGVHGRRDVQEAPGPGQAGDNVGVLLRGTKREEVDAAKCWLSGFDHAAHQVTADLRALQEEGGGTRRSPRLPAAFYFRTTDVTGSIELPKGTELVMPGDNISITVQLIQTDCNGRGLRFAIREGGRTVGAGSSPKSLNDRKRSAAVVRREDRARNGSPSRIFKASSSIGRASVPKRKVGVRDLWPAKRATGNFSGGRES